MLPQDTERVCKLCCGEARLRSRRKSCFGKDAGNSTVMHGVGGWCDDADVAAAADAAQRVW